MDDITSTAYLTPTELDKKFYIIRKASTMNESAQNKLLKTLEEAPPKAVIILEITSVSAMLPTVLSRCNRIEVAPTPDEKMRTALSEYYGDRNLDLAVSLSNGYFGIGFVGRGICKGSRSRDGNVVVHENKQEYFVLFQKMGGARCHHAGYHRLRVIGSGGLRLGFAGAVRPSAPKKSFTGRQNAFSRLRRRVFVAHSAVSLGCEKEIIAVLLGSGNCRSVAV